MLRRLLAGCVLGALAAVAVLIGSGSDLEHVALLGAALGGVLGLVPTRWPVGKLGGFLVGFVAAWMGFALRAAVLPDSAAGRAVAAFGVVVICGAVAAVSRGRLPLWSSLLGAAALVGAYETTYTNAPSELLTQSPQSAMTMLFAVAVGLFGTVVVTTFLGAGTDDAYPGASVRGRHAEPEHPEPTTLEALTTGDGR